jgi:hypothetical protein
VRPRAIITDKLRSYAAAKVEVMPSVEHQQQGRLNNRAENSHQLTREREPRMRGFKSPGRAQRFLATFGVIASFFVLDGIYWRSGTTARSCAAASQNGVNLWARSPPSGHQPLCR